MKKRIKNVKGRSTSSEEAPEYFGAKRRLSLKNENIMCDTTNVGLNDENTNYSYFDVLGDQLPASKVGLNVFFIL